MYQDPIADLLTRLRNAQKADIKTVVLPYSRLKSQICESMKKNQFIEDVKVINEEKKSKKLEIQLLDSSYQLTFKRVSKPGQKIYKSYRDLAYIKNRLGIAILSSPKGIITDREARKLKVGGEVICHIY